MHIHPRLVTVAFTLLLAGAAYAQAPNYTITQIGASFSEPPPGREKALRPWGSVMEKVETSFVVSFTNRVVADTPTFGDQGKVQATAFLKSGGTQELGPASVGNAMKRISEDRRKATLTVTLDRLPEQPVKGIRFQGSTKIGVAKGTQSRQLAFTPRAGETFDFGLGPITLVLVEGNSLSLTGGDPLDRLYGLRLLRPDGTSVTAERGAWTRQGGTTGPRVTTQWRFEGPVVAGRLEFQFYEGLEEFNLPIDLLVARPY